VTYAGFYSSDNPIKDSVLQNSSYFTTNFLIVQYISKRNRKNVWVISRNFLLYKNKDWNMLICNKCYNEHHDQCMGKAGMFSCGCTCL